MAAADEKDPGFPSLPEEEDYEHLIEDYSHLAPPSEGEVLQGHVVKVTPTEAIVDVGLKLEGVVPIDQLRQPDGSVAVKPGDTIDVVMDRHGHQPEGYILLSFSRASRLRIWDTLDQAMRDQLLVSGRVLERTKGGLTVDVGVTAFMPGSQVDVRPIHDLDQFVGQDIPVKIIKLNRRRGNVVVSRKLAVEDEVKTRRQSRSGESVRRRGGQRDGQESYRIRRLCRFGRHRRIAAHQRYFARAYFASFRSTTFGR